MINGFCLLSNPSSLSNPLQPSVRNGHDQTGWYTKKNMSVIVFQVLKVLLIESFKIQVAVFLLFVCSLSAFMSSDIIF